MTHLKPDERIKRKVDREIRWIYIKFILFILLILFVLWSNYYELSHK